MCGAFQLNKLGFNAIAAMVCITLIITWALSLGFDGVLLMSAIAIISGLGGFPVATKAFQYYKDNLQSPMEKPFFPGKQGEAPGK